ncbi:MAG: FAD-binding oxidoreductase [Halobacteriales archaeon]|nr:FAD-binding oxidoreductase [Halobacteriales archaeon]
MDLRSPRPFWLTESASTQRFPRLDHDVEADVGVVGAGITGALVAHELAKRGHDVVVVDKRPIASGSTAASTALLLYEAAADGWPRQP